MSNFFLSVGPRTGPLNYLLFLVWHGGVAEMGTEVSTYIHTYIHMVTYYNYNNISVKGNFRINF